MMSLVEQLEKSLADNHRSARALRASILGTAFSGKLVPKMQATNPPRFSSNGLQPERASSNGHKPARTRKTPYTSGEGHV